MIDTILFDLDDTLYPRDTGIMDHIRDLILDYMRTYLRLSEEEAETLRRKYLRTYGTTMRGLQLRHGIDAEEFLTHVHNIPIDVYVQPNPGLDDALASIPERKVIFTNASREHAARVLKALGIECHFDRIVDVRDIGYENKPQPLAYLRVCELLAASPEHCLLVEDSIRNLRPAKELGMTTVLVGANETDGSVDYAIERVEEITRVLETLREG